MNNFYNISKATIRKFKLESFIGSIKRTRKINFIYKTFQLITMNQNQKILKTLNTNINN